MKWMQMSKTNKYLKYLKKKKMFKIVNGQSKLNKCMFCTIWAIIWPFPNKCLLHFHLDILLSNVTLLFFNDNFKIDKPNKPILTFYLFIYLFSIL